MAIHIISDSVADVQPRNRISSPATPPSAQGWPDTKGLVPPTQNLILRAMSPVVVSGKWLGFLALRGLLNPKQVHLGLPRVAYLAVSVLGMATQALLAFVVTDEENDATTSIKFVSGARGHVVYMLVAVSLILLLLRLSVHWPCVATALKRLERRLTAAEFPPVDVGRQIRNATAAVLVANFIVELAVDMVPYCLTVVRQGKFEGFFDFIRELFYATSPPFRTFPDAYNVLLALWLFWVRIQTKCAMAFCDLLLGTLSCVLAAMFKSVKDRVGLGDFKSMTNRDWQDIRETYNDILDVTTAVNRLLGPLILISYSAGLWFICGGILLLLAGSETDPWKQVYLFLSMIFWSLRLVVSTLAMSAVSEQNRALRRHLHAVPTALYSYEVNRLTMQACHNEVGLTGMDFFTVTRSVLLTLVGTVASYEVVLMQFTH